MHSARRIFILAATCATAALLEPAATFAQAPAPAPAAPATRDAALAQKGDDLGKAGKHAEAAKTFEELVKSFPTSPLFPEATFKAGYQHYSAGEYDEAVAFFQKVLAIKPMPPELALLSELALSLTPQVLAEKASKLPPGDPARKAALENAVKQFDVYLQKYPTSEEAESATFSKALALYELAKYDDVATALRGNMQKFAQSPTVQESQYLLALTLGTIANVTMQNGAGEAAGANTNYDDAEKLLRDIVAKRQNVALVNDSLFQLGELLVGRGGFTEDKEKRAAIFTRALEAYRAVLTKDIVVAEQKKRIAQMNLTRTQPGIAGNKVQLEKLNRNLDKEAGKLAQIEAREDQTVTAKIKTGEVFFQLGKWDEVRVLFSYIDQMGLSQDAELKKQMLYYVTMTYGIQGIADKAVEKYNAFQAAHKSDPIAQNLQLVIGSMFLGDDPKLRDPEKAINYFKEGLEIYPKGKAAGALVLAQARAMIEQKKFPEALAVLKETLDKKPVKDLAVDAEFYLGTIYAQTGKTDEAVKAFKGVREKYSGTPQAEQASFQVGQLLLGTDAKGAVGELQAFIAKFPKSELLPSAIFSLGTAQSKSGQTDAALATFKNLAAKFPQSTPAPFSFFERAQILSANQKFDECIAVMREFIAAYPENSTVYQAYDFIAQIQTSQNKAGGASPDAVAAYEEFVQKRPKDPKAADALLKLSTIWKGHANAQEPYLANESKRPEWHKGVDKSTAAAERVLTDFPESQAVALALNNLLDVQMMQQVVKLKTEPEIEQYFQDLAKKFASHPGTRSKILFTLAAYTIKKDKAKAVEQMAGAYKDDLKFAPEDLDLYGLALIENNKADDALKVYEKLAKDFPLPPAGTAPREIQEAQAIALAGQGKALQAKGEREAGAKKFAELERLYGWSKKMLEVNYGLALDLHDKKQDDDAMKRLLEVIKAQTASAELRAQSALLLGKIHAANGRFDAAIDNFIKISVYYQGVPKVAAEGLWLGGQLLERQASGEIPMPTPVPKAPAKPASAKAPASKTKK